MKEVQISVPIVEKKYKAIIVISFLAAFAIFGYTAFEGKAINGSKIAIELIEVYQNHLSDKVPFVKCKYQVTCSEYAKKAIKEQGLRKGIVLSFKRIHSCM
jgi:hypothetical protein